MTNPKYLPIMPQGERLGLHIWSNSVCDSIKALTNLNTAYPGQVLILAYEDHIIANSDKDFNDLIFAFAPLQTSTQVPEPTTLLLLELGLVGVAGIRRKFKK
jgi:hypothetical protein